MRLQKIIIGLFLLLLTASAASAQENDFKALLFSKEHPLTLTLKDLSAEWRSMNVAGASGDTGNGNIFAMMMGMVSNSVNSSVYYTKGDTLTVGTETFIVAYHPPVKPLNMAALMRGNGNPQLPAPDAYTPDTKLTLSLLNLKAMSAFSDIRPFDLKAEMDAHKAPPPPPVGTESLSNLKQMGTALLMYAQDYDDRLPPMKKMETTEAVLMPYIKNNNVFINPDTKEHYKANPAFSEQPAAKIDLPASTVAFYEATPAKDGTRGVCFMDGHSKRIAEADWPALKAKSKIP